MDYAVDKLKDVELFLDEKILLEPLTWRKPRMIFVCSMTDLFGEFVPKEFICEVLARMGEAQQHTFQVLTKRPARMKALLEDIRDFSGKQPPPHILWGASVENQATYLERAGFMEDLAGQHYMTWYSYEPALGPIQFDFAPQRFNETQAKWVVIGGESGPKARPFDLEWARSAIQQCRQAGVPVFMKQLGTRPFRWLEGGPPQPFGGALHNKKGGDPAEWPEDLRVREWPK